MLLPLDLGGQWNATETFTHAVDLKRQLCLFIFIDSFSVFSLTRKSIIEMVLVWMTAVTIFGVALDSRISLRV